MATLCQQVNNIFIFLDEMHIIKTRCIKKYYWKHKNSDDFFPQNTLIGRLFYFLIWNSFVRKCLP